VNQHLNEKRKQELRQLREQNRKKDPERWEIMQTIRARRARYKPKPKPLIEVVWRRMTLSKPPKGSGIYAIKSGRQWLYIGKAQSVCARVLTRRHPVQITLGLDALNPSYWYCLLPADLIHRAECQQIKEHKPEWNGGTEFYPYGTIDGPTCAWTPPLTNFCMESVWGDYDFTTTPCSPVLGASTDA
jgi:hypothetical protein